MKVILVSLLLTLSASVQACKTCYYYEQNATSDCQSEDCSCCSRPTGCDPSSEHCGANKPTWELIEDYYDESV